MRSVSYKQGAVLFFYNSDFSGDVKIWTSADAVVEEGGYVTVTIDGRTLESFILDRIRDDIIDRLEQAEGPELRKMLGRMA